ILNLGATGWIAVSGEPHQFVFVAIVRETEILRHRLIEDTERVRKQHPAIERQQGIVATAPCRTGKITKAVNRYDIGVAKWRNVECRGEMCEMVLDVFDRPAN